MNFSKDEANDNRCRIMDAAAVIYMKVSTSEYMGNLVCIWIM